MNETPAERLAHKLNPEPPMSVPLAYILDTTAMVTCPTCGDNMPKRNYNEHIEAFHNKARAKAKP